MFYFSIEYQESYDMENELADFLPAK